MVPLGLINQTSIKQMCCLLSFLSWIVFQVKFLKNDFRSPAVSHLFLVSWQPVNDGEKYDESLLFFSFSPFRSSFLSYPVVFMTVFHEWKCKTISFEFPSSLIVSMNTQSVLHLNPRSLFLLYQFLICYLGNIFLHCTFTQYPASVRPIGFAVRKDTWGEITGEILTRSVCFELRGWKISRPPPPPLSVTLETQYEVHTITIGRHLLP